MRIIRICTSIISPLLGLDLEGQMTDNMASLTRRHSMSNYTPAMIAKLQAAAPLNLAKAKDLAADFGLSHRSVISKAKHLGSI